ncbi:NAD-P-binding protein [Trametes meyenii]|nr:NAD-P-binding protein [Trametes meyenii]
MSFSAIGNALKLFFPGKPTWSPNRLPDLSARTIIVTGGNAGIGRETVKQLLLKNATVYMAARSRERAERAIWGLRQETGKEAFFLHLDLSDLRSVKKAAEEYKQRESRLDVLYLNAGIVYPPRVQLTEQGYDATFGTNVLGHYLFARLLYSTLKQSSRSPDTARVVWLSSMANYAPRVLHYETYRQGPARDKADLLALYGESKLAAVLASNALARRCAADGIVSIAVDPGTIKSDIYRESCPWYYRLGIWDTIFSYPTEYGALTSLYSGCMPKAAEYNGKYMRPWTRLGEPNPLAQDVQEQERLWTWLEEQVKDYL